MTMWEMDLLRRLMNQCGWTPEHTIIIHTPYKDASKRLQLRARAAEKNIKLEFLQQIEFRHEAFLKSGLCGKVHILDGTLSKEELLASAMAKVDIIQREKTSWWWTVRSSLKIPLIDLSNVDREIKMATFRIILGPLPQLIAQTFRGTYFVPMDRSRCEKPNPAYI